MNYPVPLTRAQQLAGLRHACLLLVLTGPGGSQESGAGFQAVAADAESLLEACEQSDAVERTGEGPATRSSLAEDVLATLGCLFVCSGVVYAAYQIIRNVWVWA